MKTTQLQKPAVPVPSYGIGQRRDEIQCAQFIQSALSGLLACNSFYDGDTISFRDGLETEKLLDKAEELGLDAFSRWKAWRKRERAVQALKTNPKAVIK
jgi:hypothetical protein